MSPDEWPERNEDLRLAREVAILHVATLSRMLLAFELAVVGMGFLIWLSVATSPYRASLWLVEAVILTIFIGAATGWGLTPLLAWRRAKGESRSAGMDLAITGGFKAAIKERRTKIGRPSVLIGHRNRPLFVRLREAPGRWGYVLSIAGFVVGTGLREFWLTPMSFWFPGSTVWYGTWLGLATLASFLVAHGLVYFFLFWPLEELRLAAAAVQSSERPPTGV